MKSLKFLLRHPTLEYSRFSKANLVIFILVFAGIGGYILLFSHAAGTTANLWVDTDGGTCTRSASPATYDTLTACGSMQSAMIAAQAGDTVIIKDGTYSSQTISNGTKAGVVSFYAETPSEVLLDGNLSLDGVDRIHIYGVISAGSGESRHGLSICDTNCKTSTTQDILVDGFHGKSAFIRGTNVTIDHSEFGGFSACLAGNPEDAFRFWDGTGGSVTPTNDTIRNSTIHDVDDGVGDTCQGTVNAGRHVDCMQNNGGDNLLIEKNIFYNCPTSNIQDSPFSGATIGKITIENNFLGKPHCCNSVAIGPASGSGLDCSALVVRYNDFGSGSINSTTCGSGNLGLQAYGNIFISNIFACGGGVTYSYNIFHPTDGPACGTNSKRCSPNWVNVPPAWGGGQPDPHLASTDTCAIGAADPARYPASDIDGDARPQGAAPAAGADEYVPAADFYVSASGSDTNPGTQSQPFATFDKCYRAKSPVVCEVAGGTYTAQTIKFDLTKTSTALGATFRPAIGAVVTIDGGITLSGTTDFTWQGPITVNGNISVSDCNITSNCTSGTIRYAKDVTFDGQSWDACHVVGQPSGGGNLNADGSINVTFRYCFSDKKDVTPGPAGLSTSPSVKDGQVPTNITYDHVHWYGGSNPSHYADCLHPFDMNGLTVTNNEFEWCEDYPILFNRTNGAADAASENPSLIQNNICLASFAGNNSFSLGNPNTENMWNVTVSFNTCGLSLNSSTPMVNVRYQGNIRPVTSGANCNSNSGLTADHNLNRDTKGGVTPAFGSDCSGRDTYVNLPVNSIFEGYPAELHLTIASPGRNIVPAALCPATDFDGQSRDVGDGFCDAGADEYTADSSGLQGDLNSDGHVNITDLSISLSHYGQSGQSLSTGDCTGDGTVNITDLSILLSHYGT